MVAPGMFPYPQYCALTCFALRAKLAAPIAAAERAAILGILERRMLRVLSAWQ